MDSALHSLVKNFAWCVTKYKGYLRVKFLRNVLNVALPFIYKALLFPDIY